MATTMDVSEFEVVIKHDNLGLSEAEKTRLESVLKRAKEVDEEDFFRHSMEGTLNKYTNVVKGWQNRWFVLDPMRGSLEYYVTEDARRNQRPRGSVHLAGAVISPSDEDSQTFNVNTASAEVYRLRAVDARERQHWVSRLRAVVQRQGDVLSQLYETVSISPSHASSDSLRTSAARHLHHSPLRAPSTNSLFGNFPPPSRALSVISTAAATVTQESLRNAREIISLAEEQQKVMVQTLECLPSSGHPIGSLDHDCLLLKSTSHSTMGCLEDCLDILQRQDSAQGHRAANGMDLDRSMANIRLDLHSTNPPTGVTNGNDVDVTLSNGDTTVTESGVLQIDPADEVVDSEQDEDKDLDGVEEHKSVILHLLSQLKLGMDLTKVVLPTFILEKRSLLEMYADFMAHPDMFLRIPDCPTAESRMMAVFEYYLCSFHVGRKGSIAKKPYNPIIGEVFHCSWEVHSNQDSTAGDQDNADKSRVTFVAEQVSHHPPVSAFYVECPNKRICMNTWIWTKSKFLGMSVGVTNAGEGTIRDLVHGEDYTMTFPSAYGRSILTIPWMELGGRCTIQCTQTGYQASITFQTKPFYGGKVHRLIGEVKNPQNTVTCRVQGEWNGQLEFTYSTGERKVIDTTRLAGISKRMRPVALQGAMESRRLWRDVTLRLKSGDINSATDHKRYLEETQRQEEKDRRETNVEWQTKLFHKKGDGWVYDSALT